ncbi:MAG: prolyl aminopeptidase [Alphaproteobacteria bacterium]|nr:prolyl aminopeptidase [Alphaproteobacteria bacterium]
MTRDNKRHGGPGAPFRTLFPSLKPFEVGKLSLDGPHVMYWEQSGNPAGIPVVFLHGGPGAGAGTTARRFFDPGHYRIIVFDQRGAGRSAPVGELSHNTTPHLIADMERLRQHLGIEKWILFGGSWGSTLALAYGEAHPERCLGFILRGIFLCRRSEIHWFLYGMKQFFPETWRDFAFFLPEKERGDLLAGYSRRLDDPDPAVHFPAARAWSHYEGACSTLLPSPDTVAAFDQDATALGLARTEAHYFRHGAFMEEDALLSDLGRLHGIPAVIVQGRYDVVCPPASAIELVRAWEGARLVMVADAGHAAVEPGITRALVAATEDFKKLR